jgi:multidrug resistance efflux pump
VRLQGEENLQAAIEAARYELTSARYALDQLYDDPELKVAQAYQEVVDARIAVRDAQRRLNNLNVPTRSRDIEQTRANVAILKDRMERARKDYRPFENKPEDNLTRAALLSKLAQIEKQYEDAVRKLNNQLGTVQELDLQEATADLQMAEARLQTAERDYELKKAGPDPEDVALAEARIDNAQAQLTAAEAALDDLLLLSPFPGTVTELSVKPGEWIAPGQPLLQLADLSELHIETTDLNEIDVARVEIGDAVLVTFDALPGVVLGGKVTRIAPKASAGAGVNYTVWIELDEIPDALRWGMTAFVDIEVGS